MAFSPSPPPSTSTLGSGAAQSRARLLNGPAAAFSSGRRDSLSSVNSSSGSSSARPWPRIQISCVRVGPKTEFATPNTTIEFAPDRIALVIRGKTTTILHSELKLVEVRCTFLHELSGKRTMGLIRIANCLIVLYRIKSQDHADCDMGQTFRKVDSGQLL